MTKVLITRPQEAASELANKLIKAGYSVLSEPMFSIQKLDAAKPNTSSTNAIILTSRNALTSLNEIKDLLALPCFCVGPKTAEAAAAKGFKNIKHSEGSKTELLELINAHTPTTATLLHICGTATDDYISAALTKTGRKVNMWRVYEAKPFSAFSPELRQALEKNEINAALFFSPRTARIFAPLAAENNCANITAIAISAEAAEPLKTLNWKQIAIAQKPLESNMVETLTRVCPVIKR
ncbi:MAG: uroporphyrinogen-III synthase [Alphaproteobacteria bacterium]|nr:uroporphyrinogen-III synthase [Alphaproteobacteria bacterium]